MIGNVQSVVLDCADASGLARFYQAILGGVVNQPDARWTVDDDFTTLHTAAGLVLTFQRVADYQPPQWPDTSRPQQLHLDIEVKDPVAARQRVIELGATVLDPGTHGWWIYADPAGHPFCLLRPH